MDVNSAIAVEIEIAGRHHRLALRRDPDALPALRRVLHAGAHLPHYYEGIR